MRSQAEGLAEALGWPFESIVVQLRRAWSWIPAHRQPLSFLRYGLEDGRVYTLEEVGQTIGVTRERVRQLEAQALNRLRQSSARVKLRDYLYGE